jgi:hypothetical protein
MLDSKDVAMKALAKAEMTRAIRKGNRQRRIKAAALALCSSAIAAAMVYIAMSRSRPTQ